MAVTSSIRDQISVLVDPEARIDERDDAAMDLGNTASTEALSALVDVASNAEEDETLLQSCGESIAQIWLALGRYDPDIWERLALPARRDAQGLLQKERPGWFRDDGQLKPTGNEEDDG